MKLLLLLGYYLFGMQNREVVVVANEIALPDPAAQQEALRKEAVTISLAQNGEISAKAEGENSLASFLPKGEKKMKPLDDWLAKLQKERGIKVSLEVDPEARQQGVIDLLNVLAARGVTEVVFREF